MAFTNITVLGTYLKANGSFATGFIRLYPAVPIRNGTTVISAPVDATLNGSGQVEVIVAATTDPGTTPSGATYRVEEHLDGLVGPRKYNIVIPYNGGDVNLAIASPVVPAPAAFAYLTQAAADALYAPIGGGGGGGLDAEGVRDVIIAAVSGTGLITVTDSDVGDTTVISTTATANSSDATLLARANHTGTQAQSTVTNLVSDLTALDSRLDVIEHTANALTDASTIAVNATLGRYYKVTVAGNRVLGNPTGAYDGQILVISVKQDATGSRTISLDTKYRLPTGQTITWSTIANRKDRLCVQYDVDDDKFDVVGFQPGFA